MYNNKIMNDEINKIISLHKQDLYHEALGNIKFLLFEQNNNPILHNLIGVIYLSLKDLAKSLISLTNKSGCSRAAKCPPFDILVQR